MPDVTDAETPEPFPSIATPTSSRPLPVPPVNAAPAPSYRELERRLVPLPDSSHRPSPAEQAKSERPRAATVTALGGSGAFPSAGSVAAAIGALESVDSADVQLAVDAGVVTMSGSVARSSDRDRIAAALARVHGLVEVVDRLRIRLE